MGYYNLHGLLVLSGGVLPEVPVQIGGLFSFFYPKTEKTETVNSKLQVTDSEISTNKYLSKAIGENPTEADDGHPYLSFDNVDDKLYNLMYPQLISQTTVPDLADSVTGKGFTNTGIAYDESTGNYWVINEGRSTPGDGTYDASLLKVSIDLTTSVMTILNEYNLLSIIPTIQSVQGVTVDTSDNTLWVASLSENKLYNVTKDGVLIGANTITLGSGEANGLAYDSINNHLWVGYTGNLKRYNKLGVLQQTVSVGQDIDHLYLDSNNGLLYCSYGSNGTPPHRVNIYDITLNRYYEYVYYLEGINAIEGICIVGNRLVVMNDEYFHSVGVSLNQVAVFDIFRNLNEFPVATSFMWTGVYTSPTTVIEGGELVWSMGETNNNVGIRISHNTISTLRLAANTAAGTSKSTIAQITPSPTLSTKSLLVYIIDFVNSVMYTYQNGVLIDTESSINCDVSGIRMLPNIIADWTATSRPGNIKLYGYSIHLNKISINDRQLAEGYWAWEQGLEGILPVDHPYKSLAP